MKNFVKSLFKQTGAKPSNNLWMVSLRCGIALISLLHFMALQPDFDSIFSAHAFIPPDVAAGTRDFLIPSVYSLYKNLQNIVPISYDGLLWFVRLLYPVALFMLLTGLFTRPAAILSLALQLLITNSMEYYSYGVDLFTSIALFYCCVFPVGGLISLDTLWFKKQAATADRAARCLKLFQTHVCLIYFFSGFEKLLGYNWRNGEAIWRMVHGYNATESVSFDFMYNTPLPLLAGWLTIVLEMMYPLINISWLRKWWLGGAIIFHVSIAFFMGLYFFSSVMIVLNVTAYYMPFVANERKKIAIKAQQPQLIEA